MKTRLHGIQIVRSQLRFPALLLALVFSSPLQAQLSPSVEVLSRDLAGAPNFVRGSLGLLDPARDMADEAAAFALEFARAELGARGGESFSLRSANNDELGQTHIRLDQQIDGLRAVGAQLIVHVDTATGEVIAVNGHLAPAPSQPPARVLPADEALGRALATEGLVGWMVDGPEQVYVRGADGGWHQAWRGTYELENGENGGLEDLFAAAADGELVARHGLRHTATSRRTYRSFLDPEPSIPDFWVVPGQLLCVDQQSCGDPIAQQAHDNAETALAYYLAAHGRDSYDGAGATVRTSVGHNENPENAFWDPTFRLMGFGDGGLLFDPLGNALDVVAHELTHGVTRAESGLIFQGESGALSEALSDIFAAATEAWAEGPGPDVWKYAEDVFTPTTPGDAARYMDDPSRDRTNPSRNPHPEFYSRDFYPDRFTLSLDRGGVHFNSGIANLAFYLLSEGGQHPRGKTTNQVPGISIGAAAKIFYRAQTTYLAPSSYFSDARAATLQAAEDLFGAGSFQVDAVAEAWDAVGVSSTVIVHPPFVSFETSCNGLDCEFRPIIGTSPGAFVSTYIWGFPGGATASIPRPRFFFPGYGTYTVALDVIDSNNMFGQVAQEVAVTPSGVITPRVGSWDNPQRNGNGIDFLRTSDGSFVLGWYTFTPSGAPIWYTTKVRPKSDVTWSSPLRKATLSGSSVSSETVGSVTLEFSSPKEAWFSWSFVDGPSGGERFEFFLGGFGRTGAWFDPAEPGWGVQVQEQDGAIGAIVTFFEGSQPRWVGGSKQEADGDVTVSLRWRTGLGLCPSCSGGSTSPPPGQTVGNLRLQVASGSATSGTLTTDITTPGGSEWDRGPATVQLLTEP